VGITQRTSAGSRVAWLGGLVLLFASCASEHDDAGGLTIKEEERVKAWIRQLAPMVEEVNEIDWFRFSFSSSSSGNISELTSLMRRLAASGPPIVERPDVDRTLREFHEALRLRCDAVLDVMGNFNHQVQRINLRQTSLSPLWEDMEELDASSNRIGHCAIAMSEKITDDFADDSEFQLELQAFINRVSGMFNPEHRGHKLLPSMMASAPGAASQPRPIIPGTAPPPSAIPGGVNTSGNLGPIQKLP